MGCNTRSWDSRIKRFWHLARHAWHRESVQRIKEIFGKVNYARLAELVDAVDSKSTSERSAGSSPAMGTNKYLKALVAQW